MKITINLPHNAGTVDVDFAALPQTTKDWAIAYGVRQGVVDAAAGAKAFADENNLTLIDAVKTLVDKRLARMAAGTMGVREAADPLGAAIKQVLSKVIKDWGKVSADDKAKAVAKIKAAETDAHKAILAQAEKIVAAGAKVAAKVDLESLGL